LHIHNLLFSQNKGHSNNTGFTVKLLIASSQSHHYMFEVIRICNFFQGILPFWYIGNVKSCFSSSWKIRRLANLKLNKLHAFLAEVVNKFPSNLAHSFSTKCLTIGTNIIPFTSHMYIHYLEKLW